MAAPEQRSSSRTDPLSALSAYKRGIADVAIFAVGGAGNALTRGAARVDTAVTIAGSAGDAPIGLSCEVPVVYVTLASVGGGGDSDQSRGQER